MKSQQCADFSLSKSTLQPWKYILDQRDSILFLSYIYQLAMKIGEVNANQTSLD